MLKKKFYKVVYERKGKLTSCIVGPPLSKVYRVGKKSRVVDEGLVFENRSLSIYWAEYTNPFHASLEVWECEVKRTENVDGIYPVSFGQLMKAFGEGVPPLGTRRAYNIKLTKRVA